jgi:heat shock transcription factor
MYGLRKTFHVTDGSLQQFGKAPKRTKSPNMYSHPYFRRDRADLLCLIQKPESRSSSKRTYDGIVKAVDSGDDEKHFSPHASGCRPPAEPDVAVARSDPVSLPRNVISVERHELEKLQNHQQCISEAITQLKQQSDATVRQAAASQAIHDKHKSAIDAILTFLANSYNCSTEGQAGQHFVYMSRTVAERGNEQTGSVVEASTRAVPDCVSTTQGFELLPALKAAPFLQPRETPGIPQMAPSSARKSTSPVDGRHSADSVTAQTARSQLLDATLASAQFEDCATTRNLLQSVPDSNQIENHQHNINVIGTTAPGTIALPFDFTSALTPQQIARVDPPLVAERSDDMLDIVSNIQCCFNDVPISSMLPAMPDLNECKET